MDVLANSKEQILADIRADELALHFNVFSFANYSKGQPRNFCEGSSKKALGDPKRCLQNGAGFRKHITAL
jgi:hypothetical protein